MDIIDIVLSKKYTDESLKGITGTLAGKNCTIKSATKADGVTTVVFAWTADDGTEKTTTIQVNDGAKGDIGIGIDNMTINANSHLIVTLSDGSTIDAGLIQGGSGTDDYEDLINRPKIESVDLIGNKTFEDLGVASATDLAQTDGHLQDLADLVGDKANLPMPNETVVNNIEYVDTKVDSLIDDNVTGLTKTFSSDKIAKTFATLEEVNERLIQSFVENEVGTYVDESGISHKMYEKTFNCGALPDNSIKNIPFGSTYSKVLSISGMAYSVEGHSTAIPSAWKESRLSNTLTGVMVYVAEGSVKLNTYSDMSTFYTKSEVTVRYIKD